MKTLRYIGIYNPGSFLNLNKTFFRGQIENLEDDLAIELLKSGEFEIVTDKSQVKKIEAKAKEKKGVQIAIQGNNVIYDPKVNTKTRRR